MGKPFSCCRGPGDPNDAVLYPNNNHPQYHDQSFPRSGPRHQVASDHQQSTVQHDHGQSKTPHGKSRKSETSHGKTGEPSINFEEIVRQLQNRIQVAEERFTEALSPILFLFPGCQICTKLTHTFNNLSNPSKP
jgi:hypothetical protein